MKVEDSDLGEVEASVPAQGWRKREEESRGEEVDRASETHVGIKLVKTRATNLLTSIDSS
ncbi:hypothetical protein E2C01_049744 [Portunus trituberculatus]|uniref:Uncharacterized protein n=1 Tax=Portunus trituberculatus TaxID=210409 RepID=A0A5B7G6E5_PORTR|nr:hypothetical protein [Portunus trituberculatus]